MTFREADPMAWAFHRNTSRWPRVWEAPAVSESPEPPKEYPHAPILALPLPRFPATSLEDAVAGRSSCRSFSGAAIGQVDVSTLLGAAYGVQGRLWLSDAELLERPVPSAGGLYPLELYLLANRVDGLPAGIFHYASHSHRLEVLVRSPVASHMLGQLFLGQPYASDAAAVVLLTAVVARSLKKYGDRGYRYVLMEAGHVAQNLNLTAVALGLGSCNLGGFYDDALADLLGLDTDDEIPLYGVALGRPAVDDRAAGRNREDDIGQCTVPMPSTRPSGVAATSSRDE